MKYLCWTLLLLTILTAAGAQELTLFGKIDGFAGDSVELNFPMDAGYQQGNSYYSKIAGDGGFRFDIQGSHARFALLIYGGQQEWLLLSPGRQLKTVFEAHTMNSTIGFAGEGKIENEVLEHCMDSWQVAEYIDLPEETLYTSLLPALRGMQHILLDPIDDVPLPDSLRKTLQVELSYRYATALYDFSDSLRRSGKDRDWLRWADSALGEVDLPSREALDISPSANVYLHDWAIHHFMKEALSLRKDTAIRKRIETDFGLSFDAVQQLGKDFGDDYLACIYAGKALQPDLAEYLFANRLVYYSNETLLPISRRLLSDLTLYFPDSHLRAYCIQKVAMMEQQLIKGQGNEEIVFRGDSIYNLSSLLAPYKGKVVYLDIWGTWCGPCREEIKFLPALKERFRGKGIVFLYLDMDEDDVQERWKEFVQQHAITGQHVRLNRQRLEPIWEELLHTHDVPRYYPSFFIFDGNGHVAEAGAPRPSEGERLYGELEGQLKGGVRP